MIEYGYMNIEILEELGAKPSTSEERGLAQLRNTDLMVFSPGISTAGFAEIRMAKTNPDRKIIATTIDKKGLEFAREIIKQVGLENQIETRDEDLRTGSYSPDYFDFIYARLVLHYLSKQDLDKVLKEFNQSLKPDGKLFIVVRSEKNINKEDPDNSYDPETRLTTVSYRRADGTIEGTGSRYFHTPVTIQEHLKGAGLKVDEISEYQERLYKDFMRREISSREDHVIEVIASKLN